MAAMGLVGMLIGVPGGPVGMLRGAKVRYEERTAELRENLSRG